MCAHFRHGQKEDCQCFIKKEMLFIAAFALLVFVGHASTDSNTNDDLITTPAITSNDNNANSPPDFDGDGTVGFSDFLLFCRCVRVASR